MQSQCKIDNTAKHHTKTRKGEVMRNQKNNNFKKFFASAVCFCVLCFGTLTAEGADGNAAGQAAPTDNAAGQAAATDNAAGQAAPTDTAAELTISIKNGEQLNVDLYTGNAGRIVPENPSTPLPETPSMPLADPSMPLTDLSMLQQSGTEANLEYAYVLDYASTQQCIVLNTDGSFQALAPGSAEVYITGADSLGELVFSASVTFKIYMDMTNVTLSKTSVTGYPVPSYSLGSYAAYDSIEFDIPLNSPVVLDEETPYINFSYKAPGKKMQVWASLSENILHLSASAQEKCTTQAVVSIGGKEFQITVTLKPVKISDISLLLEKGNTKQLNIKSYPGAVTWSSSNDAVASVNKSGLVKARQLGNAVITAELDGKRIGCVISVTTGTIIKICKRAAYIGANWEYSQPKRTLDGYYDCSSLVWRAYKENAGLSFGNDYYPGTTYTESIWCRNYKRIVKGGYTQKKVNKMQLNPGDLVFKSTDANNPYGTTYHVEMITGYACTGYSQSGKPYLTVLWASREPGYTAADGSLLGRPLY